METSSPLEAIRLIEESEDMAPGLTLDRMTTTAIHTAIHTAAVSLVWSVIRRAIRRSPN